MILKTFLFNQTCLYVQRLYSVPIFIAKTNCCPQWGQKNSPGMRIETLVVNGYIDLCLVNRDTFRFTTPIRLK